MLGREWGSVRAGMAPARSLEDEEEDDLERERGILGGGHSRHGESKPGA